MFQRHLYQILVVIAVLVPFNMLVVGTNALTYTFDTSVSTHTWSDDGSMLAVATETAVYSVDLRSQEMRELFTYNLEDNRDTPFQMFWSPNGKKLALIGYASTDYSTSYLSIFDTQTGLTLYSEDWYGRPSFVAFSPDSRKVAISNSDYIGGQVYDSRLFIMDIESDMLTEWRLGGYMGIAVSRLAWHPDGNQLAIQIGGGVHIYDIATQAEITSFQAEAYNFYDLDWSPDGSEIITYGRNLRWWNAVTGQAIMSVNVGSVAVDSSYTYSAWLPDNMIVITSKAQANVFDAQTGNPLYHYELPEGVSAFWSPLGKNAVSIQGNQIFIYEVEPIPAPHQVAFEVNIEATPRSSDTADIMTGLAHWSPQGDILLTTAAHITNLSQASIPVYSITVENAQIDSSLFSDDGRTVALGLSNQDTSQYEIQVWDLQRNEILHQFVGHRGLISELEFNADNTLLASGSSDTTIRVWDLNMSEQVSEMWGHDNSIAEIAFSPDSLLLASVGDERMRVWDTQTGEQLHVVNPFTDYIIEGYYTVNVRFSPDGQQIIYHYRTGDEMQGGIGVRMWNRETEQQNYFTERMSYLSDVIYSPEGGFYGLTNPHADVQLFEMQSDTKIELPSTECISSSDPLEEVSSGHWVDFSPNGRLIVILILNACLPAPLETPISEDMFEDNTIWIVDTYTGTIQHILRGNNSPSYRMFFSPDGSQLLTQHLDGTIKLWDVETGEQISIVRL